MAVSDQSQPVGNTHVKLHELTLWIVFLSPDVSDRDVSAGNRDPILLAGGIKPAGICICDWT